jgi:predicted dinucleotide-binding enzyme
MTSFTIFGKGNMGSAIASVVEAGGATVEHIDTSSDGARVNGDVVVLAVPYPALTDITARYGDQLAGKIVVDITNPLNFATFDRNCEGWWAGCHRRRFAGPCTRTRGHRFPATDPRRRRKDPVDQRLRAHPLKP